MAKDEVDSIVLGGVDECIARYPINVQERLFQMRALIKVCAPKSIETVSYFQIPGYSIPGYDYNGMFAWFSYVESNVRLHVRRPVIENAASALKGFKTTKAIVSFPLKNELPEQLIVSLVKASLNEKNSNK